MKDTLKKILLKVEKPARYVGGEFNMPNMDKPCRVRLCLCFPEIYEIGMSNIGVRILYHMLNDRELFVSVALLRFWIWESNLRQTISHFFLLIVASHFVSLTLLECQLGMNCFIQMCFICWIWLAYLLGRKTE